MQRDIVLKLVTMLSQDVHKPSIVAREFRLDAAENYRMRTSGRNLNINYGPWFVLMSTVLPHKNMIMDGIAVHFVDSVSGQNRMYALRRLDSILAVFR